MLVKCENEVENLYDVPLDSTNKELITKLLQTFLMNRCKVKLQDEKKELVGRLKSFTLRKWFDKNERSLDEEIRVVLNVKWPKAEKSCLDEVQKLEEEKAKLVQKNDGLEKEIEKLRRAIEGESRESARKSRGRKLELAHNCLWGLNGERVDYYKPHKLYEEIENAGGKLNGNAHFNLRFMYDYGCGVKKDEAKSKEFYKSAAEFYLSKKVEDLKPRDWANMGYMYVFGEGFEENKKKSVELLKKAVERGNVLAIYRLGYCYYHGFGVEVSYSEAFKLYSKAVEMGLPEAMNDLGFMYASGFGVKKDLKKAFGLYREAAGKGERTGMYNVGACYKNAEGVEENIEEAKKWYKMASDLGHEEAEEEWKELSDLGQENAGEE